MTRKEAARGNYRFHAAAEMITAAGFVTAWIGAVRESEVALAGPGVMLVALAVDCWGIYVLPRLRQLP